MQASYGGSFEEFSVGHWNAVDGRNDWQDHDTAVIFGLPFRSSTWTANVFMAMQGVQDTDWLNAEGKRPFKHYTDIRHSLMVGQLVVSVVQAANRIRCRRVIDEQGNCEPANIFILLPPGTLGEEILDGIQSEMPGIQVADWKYDRTKRKARKSHNTESLARYAELMPPGRKAVTAIQRELGISRSSFDRLRKKLNDPQSHLFQRLAQAGVRYEVTGRGQRRRARLIKEESI